MKKYMIHLSEYLSIHSEKIILQYEVSSHQLILIFIKNNTFSLKKKNTFTLGYNGMIKNIL